MFHEGLLRQSGTEAIQLSFNDISNMGFFFCCISHEAAALLSVAAVQNRRLQVDGGFTLYHDSWVFALRGRGGILRNTYPDICNGEVRNRPLGKQLSQSMLSIIKKTRYRHIVLFLMDMV